MPPDSKDLSSLKDKSSSFHRLHTTDFERMKGMYLTPEELRGFDKYKYKSEDTSPVSKYITHPFWNFVVETLTATNDPSRFSCVLEEPKIRDNSIIESPGLKLEILGFFVRTSRFFPKWLAPNVLTFSGWCLLVMIYTVTCYYDPHFTASSGSDKSKRIPSLWWLVFAAAHFTAHTFDGCDGKQARRTNSSSPLGELFDHGLDSSAAFLIPISLFSLFGNDPHIVTLWELYWIMIACLLGFYLAHWEKYNTGTLFLPWTYDASQLAIAAVYLLTFYYGVDIWKVQLVEGFPLCHVFRWTLYASSVVFTLGMTLYNMYQARISKTDYGLSFYEGILPMMSFCGMVFLFCTWATLSPAGILELQPRLFFTATGIVFSNMTCRLIVSTMSSQRCQPFNVMLYPLCAFLFIMPFIKSIEVEVALLVLYTAGIAIFHIHYAILLVRELCHHLDIYCFTIKKS